MMDLGSAAGAAPGRPAVIMAESGEVTTYAELNAESNRVANLLFDLGLRRGDHIAFMLENRAELLAVAWAAQRSGLYYTPVGTRLTADEVAYIIGNCEARVFVTSAAFAEVAGVAVRSCPGLKLRLALDGEIEGFSGYREAVGRFPGTPLAEEWEGQSMIYSSGTTGRPKGVKRALSGKRLGDDPAQIGVLPLLSMLEDVVYLSPAPLYHAAPMNMCVALLRLGATLVIMERFDAEKALEAIERHRVTHTQMVPTMFIRLLRLPAEVRSRYDLGSLRLAIHAAAPCPVDTKRRMIEWWGPILTEYYAGTENIGMTLCDSEEWLGHPGTVGRAIAGTLHILDEDGQEQPAGVQGAVYFSGGADFEYHGDPEKTAAARDPLGRGWATLGDIGYVDADGYLFLTDRRAHMIIRGGVNVYPQESENILAMHPKVGDVAVIGVPDPDLGEVVKAVVQPVDQADAGPAFEHELLAYCRERLARYKCPDSVDFVSELPRQATGKLHKRLLRDRYAAPQASAGR
ncbi:acyl-CoA synthetase [Planotetraspora sp. GP83]|uniref:acyl-CoA synthetase n=1 Tax=Planotetraspora sp. GP83 TaxID=3156264 RepID=UPI003515086A